MASWIKCIFVENVVALKRLHFVQTMARIKCIYMSTYNMNHANDVYFRRLIVMKCISNGCMLTTNVS